MLPTVTIHVVRHAEGFHNATVNGHDIRDPYLTPKGLQQCVEFETTNRHKIDLVIASPMKRTIQTALYCFAPAIGNEKKQIILLPDLLEFGLYQSNTGSPLKDLQQEFGNVLDVSHVKEDWYRDMTPLARDPIELNNRAQRARDAIKAIIHNYIATMPEKEARTTSSINVAVVTHRAFIPYLTNEDIVSAPHSSESRWKNTECRLYQIPNFNDARAVAGSLEETDESLGRRNAQRATGSGR
ncbi:histidine phosphatase superfamily [Jackrogersella minutella]|nr:histidine phosphatase superfamily [Jackrogersella minutella]